jgi:molecular chaperone HscA
MGKIGINIKSGNLEKKSYIVGIDLGTTNSLIAYVNPHTQKPEILSDSEETIIPSVIHFDSNGEPEVGKIARDKLVTDPQNTIYSVKRLLGRSYQDIQEKSGFFNYQIIDFEGSELLRIKTEKKSYNPIELSSFILKELKNQAEKKINGDISKVVITVPAYFNDSQRQAVRDAGKLAGLDVLRIINEPTAASLAYGIGLNPNEKKTIAVYDLGGGTFDISILSIESGVFEVLSTNGDTWLGGDDFDQAIVAFWIKSYGLTIHNKEENQALRILAEKAKIRLSSNKNYEEVLSINNKSNNLTITKDKFNELILPIVNKTLECCEKALKDAGLTVKDIDDIVMVGGSTKVELVQEKVKVFFEKEKLNSSLNPDEVVALGAAIEADILAGNRTDIMLLDVTPLSLGIETMGELMDVMINRNSKVPCKVSKQYTTSIDGQKNIKINVYQGERELVIHNRKLGEFTLKGIPAMPAGLPKIAVSFLLNADGILSVEAIEERSGIQQEIIVKPAYGLTDEEVEKMLLDSLNLASDDMKIRMLTESRNEAKQLIYFAEKFVKKNSENLNKDEITQTLKLILELKDLLEKNESRETILNAMDKLNDYTKPFAERIMNQSIGSALKGKQIEP